MSHARIEEVEDSDLSDPSEGDIDDFVESDIMQRIEPKAPQQQKAPAAAPSSSSMIDPAFMQQQQQQQPRQVSSDAIKDFQCLYPVYFDKTRSRAEGRRVPADMAVANPLAREIAAACAALRLQPVFEAQKSHPKDWANPGRVRVKLLSGKSGKNSKNSDNPAAAAGPGAGAIKNKHHLYILVAKHLQAHPTTEHGEALRRVRVAGLGGVPEEGKPWPRPAVPRGWKMGELLPAYSHAMTGGGVSENAFKDMMKEMQGAGGAGGMPGGGMLPPGMMPGAGGAGGAGGGGMPNMADMMSMFGGGGGGGGFPGMGGMGGMGGAGPSGAN